MFSEKLISARNENKLTQEQLAEKLYVTRQAVSRWENGKTQPDLQTLGRICCVLNVSPDYFIDVDKKEELYKCLSRARQSTLYWNFVGKHKGITAIYCMLVVLSSLSFNALSFVISSTVMDCLFDTYNVDIRIWIMLVFGVALIVALIIFFTFYVSWLRSVYFNNWLAGKGIVRTRKFL